ncbi:MAG: GH3 auxin-responsive promoter family protein [Gemmataceae bacterium]
MKKLGTSWLVPLAETAIIRRLADAAMVRHAHYRVRELDRMDAAKVQEHTLLKLVRHASRTRFGIDHGFDSLSTVTEYQARVPLRDYEFFWEHYWKDRYPAIDNQTWPGPIPYFALSSGTTSGTTKYVPVSHEMVKANRKAAFTSTALFRHVFPQSHLLTGKFFFLGGSTDMRPLPNGSFAGDLSGVAAKEVADVVRPYTFPPLDLGTIGDWEVKLPRLAEASIREPITAVSGVPSWMLKLFDTVLQLSGKRTLADVWPELRLIVHGGTLFDPYREAFRKTIGNDAVQTIDVYPSSEGFIASEDPRYHLLRVLPDLDLFFEFIPVEELGQERPTRHTLRTAEVGVNYAIALTSCAGVWSNLIGDTVRFESLAPPLLRFTGRTKYFLSAFGEHLIQEEVDRAVALAAQRTGVMTVDHHVGPVYPTEPNRPGFHQYFVEFRGSPPADLEVFRTILDGELSRLNEDYAAHRVGNLTMLMPAIRVVPEGGFAEWMASRGKAGGQNKVPRMDNTGAITKQLGEWLNQRDMKR